MAIIDCITYNGEKELFEIRYNILKDYVDKFVVVEFDKTFSGKEKEPYFLRDFPETPDKVTYFNFQESHYEKYRELAESSPNTVGADHWKREFMQKESIKDALEAMGLKDDDIVFIGDCDEIWDTKNKWEKFTGSPFKLKLLVYSYFLNNQSNEQFYGTLCSKYKWIKNECLNHLRTDAWKTGFNAGWHFTSMGGYEEVKRKLSDSYTRESYWNVQVEDDLEENIKQNKDFLGRNFTYTIDESDWPEYLKNNRHLYQHLLR